MYSGRLGVSSIFRASVRTVTSTVRTSQNNHIPKQSQVDALASWLAQCAWPNDTIIQIHGVLVQVLFHVSCYKASGTITKSPITNSGVPDDSTAPCVSANSLRRRRAFTRL